MLKDIHERSSSILKPEGIEEGYSTSDLLLLEQAKEAFTVFLKFVPALYAIQPREFEVNLAEIVWDELRCHNPARTGLVNVLLNSVDERILINYLDSLMADEVKVITHQSPFRLSLVKLYQRWDKKINHHKGVILLDNDTIEISKNLCQLAKALTIQKYKTVLKDDQTSEVLYPDDQLVSVLESILATVNPRGPIFWSQKNPNGFNAFLMELRDINTRRLSEEKLISQQKLAHETKLVVSQSDLLPLLDLISMNVPHTPLQATMIRIIKVLILQSEKLTERLENSTLDQTHAAYKQMNAAASEVNSLHKTNRELAQKVSDLELRLRKAEANNALLPLVKQENIQLRRDIARLEDTKSSNIQPYKK